MVSRSTHCLGASTMASTLICALLVCHSCSSVLAHCHFSLVTHSSPPILAALQQAVETGDGMAAIAAMRTALHLADSDQKQIARELKAQWSAKKAR